MVVMVAEFWKLLCFLKKLWSCKIFANYKGREWPFSTGKNLFFHKLAIGLLMDSPSAIISQPIVLFVIFFVLEPRLQNICKPK